MTECMQPSRNEVLLIALHFEHARVHAALCANTIPPRVRGIHACKTYMYEQLHVHRVLFVLVRETRMDRWDTYFKTTSSESGASRVLVDLDGTLGASNFEGSCVATDLAASVSGSSSLSPRDDYQVIESDSSDEVSTVYILDRNSISKIKVGCGEL